MPISEAALQDILCKTLPLYEHLGLVVESASKGIYRCRMPLNRANSNHLNAVHAAVQWAAAEVLGGFVIIDLFGPEAMGSLYGVVRSVSIEFHRPARSDIIVEASLSELEAAEIQRLFAAGDEANFRLHAVVRDCAGETVATTDAQYSLRPLRTPPPQIEDVALPA